MRLVAILVAVVPLWPANGQEKKPDPVVVTGRTEGVVTEIRPRVSGYITTLRVDVGDVVKKGQVLAELDSRVLKIEAEKAKAKLARSETQARRADAQFERIKALLAKAIIPKEEVDTAEADREVTRAEVTLAKAELEIAELNLSWTKITAPTDGRIGNRLVTEGNFVRADTDILTTVVRDEVLTVVAEIDERSLLSLSKGLRNGGKLKAEVGLATDSGFPRAAEFRGFDESFDPKTGTINVRVLLPNAKGEVRPGQFVRVRLTVVSKPEK
jgi:RND family efflux transporter MFP subunit